MYITIIYKKVLTSSSNGLSNLSLKLLRNYVPGWPAAVLSVMRI